MSETIQQKRLMVTIHVIKGNAAGDIDYDKNGKVKNENTNVTIEHGTVEWKNYMANLKLNGFASVEYKSAHYFLEEGKIIEDKELNEKLQKEVSEAFTKKEPKVQTEEQKKIAELEAKLEALLSVKNEKSEVKATNDTDIKALRKQYEEVSGGEKGDARWSKETLQEKINELKEAK